MCCNNYKSLVCIVIFRTQEIFLVIKAGWTVAGHCPQGVQNLKKTNTKMRCKRFLLKVVKHPALDLLP